MAVRRRRLDFAGRAQADVSQNAKVKFVLGKFAKQYFLRVARQIEQGG